LHHIPGARSKTNYCPRCGTKVTAGQNFCSNCGLDVREPSLSPLGQNPVPAVRALGRNNVVFVTPEGLLGARIHSDSLLFFALLIPLPLLVLLYYIVQAGALAVYIAVWIAASGLLYDELRWRGIQGLEGNTPDNPQAKWEWRVPWRSIRMADWNGRTLWFSSAEPKHKASITFDEKDAPLVERSLESRGVRFGWKGPRLPSVLTRFWALSLILFIASQAVLILAAVLPFFPGEFQMYNTILNGTRSQVAGVSFLDAFKAIYLNNIQVAWGGTIPALGQLSFGLASYNTGRVIQVIAIGDNTTSAAVLVTLYLFPHTWIEESAYPIATVAGLFAITKWRSVSPSEFARQQNRGSVKLVMAMGGVALILLAAGLVETTGLYLGLGEVVFWVPVALGYYLLVSRRRRRRAASNIWSSTTETGAS